MKKSKRFRSPEGSQNGSRSLEMSNRSNASPKGQRIIGENVATTFEKPILMNINEGQQPQGLMPVALYQPG